MSKNFCLPRFLGYLGLLPFVVPTLLLSLDSYHSLLWSHVLINYAAVILSFLGALHWAFAMTIPSLNQRSRNLSFIWSVIPSLIAWISLLVNEFFGTLLLIIFFALSLWKDKQLIDIFELPKWYFPMRSRLSFIVIICLSISLFYLT
jgi:glycerol uptake facilitator-like aquaporin